MGFQESARRGSGERDAIAVPWRLSRTDVVLSAAAAALQVRDLLLGGRGGWFFTPPTWVYVSLWAAVTACLLFRRRFPVLVALAVIAADMVGFYPAAEAVALFAVGAYTLSPRTRAGILLLDVLLHFGAGWLKGGVGFALLSAHVVIFALAPFLAGIHWATRRRLADSLAAQEVLMVRERNLLDERARSLERRRIAMEMHDVVAHGVSQMVVRAGVLEVVSDSRRADWAAEEARTISAAGRTVLEELRTALGVLRSAQVDVSTAPRSPLPSLADLPVLLQRTRDLGIPVDLYRDGDLSTLQAPYARAAYRLVQEALTNITKHAPGAPTRIHLARAEGSLTVRVVNARPAGPRTALPAGGNGLVGMRERIELLGGQVEAQALADGGFAVEARLPLPDGDRTGSQAASEGTP